MGRVRCLPRGLHDPLLQLSELGTSPGDDALLIAEGGVTTMRYVQ
jgi:hypothetical protein